MLVFGMQWDAIATATARPDFSAIPPTPIMSWVLQYHSFLPVLQEVLCEMNPEGMGIFYFVSVRGEPVLCSYETTRLHGVHAPKTFVDMHAAPGSCFYSWRFKPPIGVGIRQFWEHLKAKGGRGYGCVMQRESVLVLLCGKTLSYVEQPQETTLFGLC